jgi:hypothetical protein
MHPAPSSTSPLRAPSLAFRCALALLRALRSTALIATVALLVFSLREGDFCWSHHSRVALAYRPLFAVLFLVLLVWELRPARPRASSP